MEKGGPGGGGGGGCCCSRQRRIPQFFLSWSRQCSLMYARWTQDFDVYKSGHLRNLWCVFITRPVVPRGRGCFLYAEATLRWPVQGPRSAKQWQEGLRGRHLPILSVMYFSEKKFYWSFHITEITSCSLPKKYKEKRQVKFGVWVMRKLAVWCVKRSFWLLPYPSNSFRI